MAGKTLTGIGEDESGRHELAGDGSDSSIESAIENSLGKQASPASPEGQEKKLDAVDKSQSSRPTDRMPMFAPSGGPVVDEDKVAEGLKKLRSLDEPLGPIPTSMPTLKEGMPVVGLPTPVNPATVAAAAAAELLRSRGTAHGHALSVGAALQGSLPVMVDDRMKGTLLGHSLHLPDLPPPTEEHRPAEIHSIARTGTPSVIVTEPLSYSGPVTSDFSRRDDRFFDSEPVVNSEYEPENRRSKMMMRGGIFVAVVSIFVVAAIAWVRVRKADAPAPVEVHVAPPPAPSALDLPPPAPAAAATPPPAGAPAGVPAPEPPPPPVAAVPEEEPKPLVAPAAAPTHTHARHHEPSALPTASPTAAVLPNSPHLPHAARPVAAPSHDSTKPAVPAKRGKDEDPDGTLPLTE